MDGLNRGRYGIVVWPSGCVAATCKNGDANVAPDAPCTCVSATNVPRAARRVPFAYSSVRAFITDPSDIACEDPLCVEVMRS